MSSPPLVPNDPIVPKDRIRVTRSIYSRPTSSLVLSAFGLILLAAPASAAGLYDGYADYAAVGARLRSLADSHPRVSLLEIGESAGGRAILGVSVSGSGADRSAVFVGANLVGYHAASTEAALHLLDRLTEEGSADLPTFYVFPALAPDAHDAIFATPRRQRSANAMPLDLDRDGRVDEDGPNDLDGDGVITWLRIQDPSGSRIAHPEDDRILVDADPVKGHVARYILEREGDDDDGDGAFNEDGPGGIVLDKSFPHAFPHGQPDAGPWASFAPEARAVMDFVLERRDIAFAVVLGPANNLLETPGPTGSGGDIGKMKITLTERQARFIGVEPGDELTGDEIWERVKDLPFVKENDITKEQVFQFLGAGAATRMSEGDVEYLEKLAEAYEERLKEAGLSAKRPTENHRRGGFTPWLYYIRGCFALELDVWRIPEAEKKQEEPDGETLTLDRLEGMSDEDFLALPDQSITDFLAEIGAPPMMTAAKLKEAVEGGQLTPERMAKMARKMGGGGEDGDADLGKREREVLAWVEANAPEAFRPWSPVSLADGRAAQAGGLDPLVEWNPPRSLLDDALVVNTETILDLASKLARLEILQSRVERLGPRIWRVRVTAGNRGFLPTHTRMAARGKAHLPLRLQIELPAGADLVTGRRFATEELLDGGSGTLEGDWLVRGAEGAELEVTLHSENAGTDRVRLRLSEEAP